MDERINEEYIDYKIDTKHHYMVFTNEFNGKRYYKITVKKKNYDGTTTSFYRQLKFPKCTPPENGQVIRIKRAFEDLYVNNKDPYNPISVLVVQEYENVENQKFNEDKAYEKFEEHLRENDIPEITDEDLPF